jgi:succinylglutamic semialdehyde dehydrogenase
MKHMTHYINGQWVVGNGKTFISFNPADNTALWQGQEGMPEEVKSACDAAHHALPHWSRLDFSTRANYVLKFTQRVEEKKDELTQRIASESGKPRWEAATEVAAVLGKARLSIQAYEERTPERRTLNPDESYHHLRFKPHGVIAVLGPFNFPAHLSNGHIIPALLAGNTIVYKPSELTPGVAEWMIQCWHDSGLPKGVLNCVQGSSTTAKLLLDNDIQGVYFTGSYSTGVQINQRFSDRPEVILALEMGGNNPLIIDKVSNLNAAVYQALLSSFISAGQRCTCARRMMIPDDALGDEFLRLFLHKASRLRIGPWNSEPEPFMGPVIRLAHATAHLQAQERLKQAGGVSLLTMKLLSENLSFLSPGVMDMSSANAIPDEEVFAPFVQVYRYHDFEHALTLANQTRYGLSAGLLSDDPHRYQQFYETVRAGLINWNKPTTGAVSSLPFGGVGRSGNHRPSAYFAADYCAYPIASVEQVELVEPQTRLPGMEG